MEHGLEYIMFYVQKHIRIAPLAICSNPPLVHDKPLGANAFVRLPYYDAVDCCIASSLGLSKLNKPHDDVIKWKHFPHYWPFVRGIHRSPVNSPHKGQWGGALMFFYLRLNKRLSKQLWAWCFQSPWCSLWRHYNVYYIASLLLPPPSMASYRKTILNFNTKRTEL